MSVKHIRDVEAQVVKAGDKTTIQVLISAQEGPNFAMRRFVMEPGGGMPEHTNIVEHEQYVLRGHASIGIGNETFEVHAGEVIFITLAGSSFAGARARIVRSAATGCMRGS